VKTFNTSAKLLVGAALVASSGMASAVNVVKNGSFEDGKFVTNFQNVDTLNLGDTNLTNWTIINNKVAWIQGGAQFGLSAKDGQKFLDLTDYANVAPNLGGVAQILTTTASTAYTLSFWVGSSNVFNAASAPVIVLGVAGINIILASTPNISPDFWQMHTLNFTTPIGVAGQSTALSFLGLQGVSYVGLDNVSVTVVPEPGTMAMLFAGLAAVGTVVARKRKQIG